MGILNALLVDHNRIDQLKKFEGDIADRYLYNKENRNNKKDHETLVKYLKPVDNEDIDCEVIENILKQIKIDNDLSQLTMLTEEGNYRIGILTGYNRT